MRISLALIIFILSFDSYSKDMHSWPLFILSGVGESFEAYSICHNDLYFRENIAPLDGEMRWDSTRFENLNTEIKKVGVIEHLEIYDIFQNYQVNGKDRKIKVLTFKNNQEKYCPFYAWQPVDPRYVQEMNSDIVSSGGNQIVGHHLNVYRGTYYEYFLFHKKHFIKLDFIQPAIELLTKKDNLYIRNIHLDIEKLEMTVMLARMSDGSFIPNSYLIKYEISNGKLGIVSVDSTNS